MDRITVKQLNAYCETINHITGSPLEYGQIGNYHVSQEYKGYNFYRITNEGGGGVENIFSLGAVPAKELYNLMRAFVAGYQSAKGE